ncbi:MAG: phosphodiester glycosidase family protein [Planctomycetota bacterium]|nr:phosphodiester glycosidase family protein [Planctomycetota bacterium]
MIKKRAEAMVWWATCAVLVASLVGVSLGYSAEPAAALKTLGVQYQMQEIKEPRVNRIHVLRVDLQAGKIKPAVVVGPDPDGDGPAETALTSPLKLAAGPAVVAFINTNPWDSFPDAQGRRNRRWFAGQKVDISGLAAVSGKIRSPSQSHAASVWFDGTGRLRLGVAPGGAEEQSDEQRLTEGTAGFSLIMKAGKVVVGEGGAVHPRTSIGVDRTGKVAWLVVVDGRQRGFSEGMNLHELALRMKKLGCWDAMNMDGGGSSVMGLVNQEGKMQVFNSPSDRRRGRRSVRPLPMVLTLRKVGAEKQTSTDKRSGTSK